MNEKKTVDEADLEGICNKYHILGQAEQEILQWHKQEIVSLLDDFLRECEEESIGMSKTMLLDFIKQKIQEIIGEKK